MPLPPSRLRIRRRHADPDSHPDPDPDPHADPDADPDADPHPDSHPGAHDHEGRDRGRDRHLQPGRHQLRGDVLGELHVGHLGPAHRLGRQRLVLRRLVGRLHGHLVVLHALDDRRSERDGDLHALPPKITSLSPTSGAAGTAVTITGTAFTGATDVAFNGTPVTAFTVVSATRITTTVPAGATSGKVSVTTPVGTGASTGTFTVRVGTTLVATLPATAARGARISVAATLRNATGTAISGQTITVTVNGLRFTGTTNTAGVATISVRAPTRRGTFPVSITFAGSTAYAASSVTPVPNLVVQ